MNDVCTYADCDRVRRTAKYCSTHYKRNRDGRDMDAPIATPVPIMQRFMGKVRTTPSGCMEWTGGTNGVGYGMFFTDWAGGKNTRKLAHRWYYEQVRGPIPAGLHLDHLCRDTMCVNPDHLEPVTQRVNTLRGIGVSAVHAKKTHCVNGHPFSGDNLVYRSNGRWRDCRECRRAKDRRRQAALKEK